VNQNPLAPLIMRQISQLDQQLTKHMSKFSGHAPHGKRDGQILRAVHFIYLDRMKIYKSLGVDNDMEYGHWVRENAPRN